DGQAQRLRGFEVDYQLVASRLQNRQVPGRRTSENLADVATDLTVRFGRIGTVAHEAASFRELADRPDHRKSVTLGRGAEQKTATFEERFLPHRKTTGPVSCQCLKGHVELTFRACTH